tara:strand:+ start:144 stop:305 length:162 start_codon:yes stop_codon:yes gene_type:complete
MSEHEYCGTPDCCGECETDKYNTTMENTMSIKEIMEEIEKLKARVKELEDKSN